jgi:hypothetical protein
MTWEQLGEWAKRNIDRSLTQCKLYVSSVKEHPLLDATSGLDAQAPSLHQHRKNKGHRQTVYPQSFHQPVKSILDRLALDVLNIRQAEMKRAEKREAQRKLALQLIDIGYKTLATKLHPDKGGSRDAMARLNQVRDRLKAAA